MDFDKPSLSKLMLPTLDKGAFVCLFVCFGLWEQSLKSFEEGVIEGYGTLICETDIGRPSDI